MRQPWGSCATLHVDARQAAASASAAAHGPRPTSGDFGLFRGQQSNYNPHGHHASRREDQESGGERIDFRRALSAHRARRGNPCSLSAIITIIVHVTPRGCRWIFFWSLLEGFRSADDVGHGCLRDAAPYRMTHAHSGNHYSAALNPDQVILMTTKDKSW
jgi:hypothetical protein